MTREPGDLPVLVMFNLGGVSWRRVMMARTASGAESLAPSRCIVEPVSPRPVALGARDLCSPNLSHAF